MLGNDNIMTANASEVVQKIPTDEKNYRYSSHRATAYSVEEVGC